MKKFIGFVGAAGLTLMPVMVFANTDLANTLVKFKGLVSIGGQLLMGLAFVFFVYNVILFIFASEAEAKASARASMLQSIIGFVVILGLYGIVGLLLSTFGVDSNASSSLNNGAGNLNVPTFTF
ncbi:MAG: hypothetical protein WCO65_02760 [bacterium]